LKDIFIADLHLNENQPEIYYRFKAFLDNKARNARALYILGDLFEYYLGDDAKVGVIEQVAQDLDELSDKYQTKCYFMAGNRDFLLGQNFNSSLILLNDTTLIELDEKKIILTHADALCTDDVEYQKVRRQLRDSKWQAWFLNQSISERIEFAQNARIQSQQHTQSANSQIMDVNQQAVDDLFIHHNASLMLHGHTHRPGFHQTQVVNKTRQRMVLGDWHYQCSSIEHLKGSFKLVTD
jgi:UDP-2,3-diacylglucosamine hydrolase